MENKIVHTSGAGNTFSIILENDFTSSIKDRPDFVKSQCHQHNTDGFIFLNYSDKIKKIFKWDFYNNDGSSAEMCGNATRCVGYYVHHYLDTQIDQFLLETIAGLMQVSILPNDQYEVIMSKPDFYFHSQYFWCDTGVPHIIKLIKNFNEYKNYFDECRNLRFHTDFHPRGTNVTLVQHTDKSNYLKAVSYERGVEDFTQACGTGAMAAAFYNLRLYNIEETYIEMPGGILKMNLKNLNNPTMTGPAKLLGESIYEK